MYLNGGVVVCWFQRVYAHVLWISGGKGDTDYVHIRSDFSRRNQLISTLHILESFIYLLIYLNRYINVCLSSSLFALWRTIRHVLLHVCYCMHKQRVHTSVCEYSICGDMLVTRAVLIFDFLLRWWKPQDFVLAPSYSTALYYSLYTLFSVRVI